jgi:hypothetical protein
VNVEFQNHPEALLQQKGGKTRLAFDTLNTALKSWEAKGKGKKNEHLY